MITRFSLQATAIAAGFALLACACTPDTDSIDKNLSNTSDDLTVAPSAGDTEIGSQVKSSLSTAGPFPYGITISEDFQVRADRVFRDEKGIERRKSTLTFVNGSHSAAAESLVDQLMALGFMESLNKRGPGGETQILLHKDKFWITVSYGTESRDGASEPGFLSVQWPTNSDAVFSSDRR